MNNIDNLRALAVISVFFHHASHTFGLDVPLLGEFGGTLGVQLFFLISGFLIIQSAERHNLRTYVLHRFFRIYPVYVFTFIVIGVFTGVITLDKFLTNPQGFFINLLSLQHFFPQHLIAYDVFHVSWTLTVEIVWYALAPLMVIVLRRHLNLTLTLSVIISCIWVVLASKGFFDSIYSEQLQSINLSIETYRSLFLNNHFISLLCFFLIGVYINHKQVELVKIGAPVLAATFIACVLFYPYWLLPEINPSFLTGIGLGALFVLALKLPTIKFAPTKFIAEISYSFYLTHFPIILILNKALGLSSSWYVILAFIITALVSAALYYSVERPMMTLARRLSN